MFYFSSPARQCVLQGVSSQDFNLIFKRMIIINAMIVMTYLKLQLFFIFLPIRRSRQRHGVFCPLPNTIKKYFTPILLGLMKFDINEYEKNLLKSYTQFSEFTKEKNISIACTFDIIYFFFSKMARPMPLPPLNGLVIIGGTFICGLI